MLTALAVDSDTDRRRQVAGLLALAGWEVHEATDLGEALCLAIVYDLDLLVTGSTVAGIPAAQLLRAVRRVGSAARLLVAATDVSEQLLAACTSAGALAVLPHPLDARVLVGLLVHRATTTPITADRTTDRAVAEESQAALGNALVQRLRRRYDAALPARLAAITRGVATGDPPAVAAAATSLAGTSGQLGLPEVAAICRAITADARRGVLAHHLVAELVQLAGTPAACRASGPQPERPDRSGPGRT